MDRDVTLRFYEVRALDDGHTPLENVARAIDGLVKPDRERGVADGITLRLEHLEEQGGLLLGDITRVQTENLPGHVTAADNARLPVDRIGHPAAFCYDPETSCMALQFDMKIGVGRVCSYFSQFNDDGRFGHMPVLRPDALDRFENETPKSLTVRVARVRNFRNADIHLTDVEETIERMGALFDAPSVEVTVSCRGTDGGIDRNRTIDTIRRFLRLREEVDGINTISGSTLESDEAYNFIKFLLKEKETLNLPNNAPADGRRVRLDYVRRKYVQHRGYLRAVAGLA